MGFWIYMFIMDLLIPIIMILFGRAFLKKAPKEINYVFGYRTSRSMKNRDTWEFAHRYCGKIWLICGLALIPFVAGIMLCFIGADTKTVGYVGASMLVFPLLLIILSVILTERALKNTFDKSGNCGDEKGSEERITHRWATTNGRPSKFASEETKKSQIG